MNTWGGERVAALNSEGPSSAVFANLRTGHASAVQETWKRSFIRLSEMELRRVSIEFTDRNVTNGASDSLTRQPVADLAKSCYSNSTVDALVLV